MTRQWQVAHFRYSLEYSLGMHPNKSWNVNMHAEQCVMRDALTHIITLPRSQCLANPPKMEKKIINWKHPPLMVCDWTMESCIAGKICRGWYVWCKASYSIATYPLTQTALRSCKTIGSPTVALCDFISLHALDLVSRLSYLKINLKELI